MVISYCISGEYNAISFFSCDEVYQCKRAAESLGPFSFNKMGFNEWAWEVWGLKKCNSLE
jgi:hypothetical protein